MGDIIKNLTKNRTLSGLLLVSLVGLLVISGCKHLTNCNSELSSQPRFQFNAISDYDRLQIKIDSVNKGDVYSLTIFGSNSTYHYARISPIKEDFEGVLKNGTLRNLMKEFEDNRFNYMEELYYCSESTDTKITQITLIFNNETESVVADSFNGPAGFYTIKDLLLNQIKSSSNESSKKTNVTKIKINKKITDDTRLCNYRKEDDYSNCTCQEGYIKLYLDVSLHPDCIPKICSFLNGYTFIGDLGESHSGICAAALFKHSYETCDIISEPGEKDLCYFAFVSMTKNLLVCENIKDEFLKSECYE